MISIIMKSIDNNFNNSKVNKLLKEHFVELRSVSPEGSTHVLDIDGLKSKSIKFWSLWDEEELVGCGALKLLSNNHGEFTSIRVANNYRNKGFGIKIIKHLINEAKKIGVKKVSVETGSGEFFKPARKLFLNVGFKSCEPFSHYKQDPNSCYFSKEI